MMRRPAHLLTIASIIVCLIGLADAAIGEVWDLFAVFLLLTALQVSVLVSSLGSRVTMSLRPDLARWIIHRSQRTGEPAEDVLDRSIAWFQHGLYRPNHERD